jgi:predicted nucleotidyltransferase
MVTRRDYTSEGVEAARSVLIELVHLLSEYKDDIVLIGGWIPEVLLPHDSGPHVGSMDVDIALNHQNIRDEGYKMIQDILQSRGYQQGDQPFIFFRHVKIGDHEVKVQVDLLAGEYEGTSKGHRHQKVQGVQARKVRGCDLAFEMSKEIRIEGTLPSGAHDAVTVRVASIVPFFVMKGMAMETRMKEKDAWDIYYCLLNYPGGIDALSEEFKPHMHHSLVKEGLQKIAGKFSSEKAFGPKSVSDFEEIDDPDEQERIQRDAYERVHALLNKLGMKL